MEKKLSSKHIEEVKKLSQGLAAKGVTTEEKYSPVTASGSKNDAENQQQRDITKDKPYQPEGLKPGATPTVKEKGKDRGISL